MAKNKKIMLIYPPGRRFQRGEERCQSNIDSSTSTTMRACNDLGYMAANIPSNYIPFLKDYQSESLTIGHLKNDFRRIKPDYVVLSTTNGTIHEDIHTVSILKSINPRTTFVLKGALFFDAKSELLKTLDLNNIDILIGGESEFVIGPLLISYQHNRRGISKVPGILYKKNGKWMKTDFSYHDADLDSIKFPDRSLMNNYLYKRPDTGEPQATISTSRGCPSNCTYCLTPIISGKKIRYRSPENIVEEIEECLNIHNIRNFFFKSDTFTMNKKWVIQLCNLMIEKGLSDRISWVANSRTKPSDYKVFRLMKKAGCWLVAFGIESGSEETLRRIKKGATVKDNIKAVNNAKKAGLKVYGFFMIGFPWEKEQHIKETEKHMRTLNCEFVELHLAVPYIGTSLYDEFQKEELLSESVLGKDYFNETSKGTKYIDMSKLVNIRKKILLRYHMRIEYLFNKLIDVIMNPKLITSYYSHGIKLIRNNIKN